MTKTDTIGFIGLGLMGHGMAANLLRAGYPLMVKGNRNRVPVDDLLSKGAQEARTARDMANTCDVIHLCLSNSPQIEAIFGSEDGILAGARPGLVVIDTSTADPNSTLALSEALAQKGGHLVDAPLGRTPKEAAEGTLDTMVGASPDLFEQIRPILECWAGNINHVGPVGSGHKMKLLMNLISMSYAALYSEVTVLGAKVGIPPQTVQKVIGSSRLGNGFFDTFMRYAVERDRDAHKFSITNASKDVRYANDMAAQADAMTLIASATRQYFTHAQAIGHSEDYVPMLVDHMARMNGIDMEEEVAKGAKSC